jgi:3-deoxy-manno-octulosonate cytidylyltransferase (CMP-KDO synthetase)
MHSYKKNDYIIVVPARFGSKRFKGKLLKKINNFTVLELTIRQCLKFTTNKNIIVATDDARIISECKKINISSILTSKKCQTGTDRVAEVARKIKRKFYINVQADEIFVSPKAIKKAIDEIRKKGVGVVNCYTNILKKKEFYDLNVPKLTINKQNNLMYISRSPIPQNKKGLFISAKKQVCVYAFKAQIIKKFYSKNSKKTDIEKFEDIEILRLIENDIKVRMIKVKGSNLAIDTKKNLADAKEILSCE